MWNLWSTYSTIAFFESWHFFNPYAPCVEYRGSSAMATVKQLSGFNYRLGVFLLFVVGGYFIIGFFVRVPWSGRNFGHHEAIIMALEDQISAVPDR
jgi:hypothetical protein